MDKPILLIDPDGDTEEIVSVAGALTACNVSSVKESDEAFRLLNHHLGDFAMIIIDLDEPAHAIAMVKAISACTSRPPVIVLTAAGQYDVKEIARAHGAVACLDKPLTVERLASTIEAIWREHCIMCDRWGHVVSRPHGHEQRRAAAGILAKLNATLPALTGPALSERTPAANRRARNVRVNRRRTGATEKPGTLTPGS